MIQPDPNEFKPSQDGSAGAENDTTNVTTKVRNKKATPTAVDPSQAADAAASVLSLVMIESNPASTVAAANVTSEGVATCKPLNIQTEDTTGQKKNDDDVFLKMPQQEGPKTACAAATETPIVAVIDEAVLIHRRAMNTIHSRRKRARLRIEIEVLREQCTEFKNKNTAIRQENTQLEYMIQSIQAHILQREASTATISSSVAIPPQQQLLPQFPIATLQSVFGQRQYSPIESLTPYHPFQEQQHQTYASLNTNSTSPLTYQVHQGSNTNQTIQNEPLRTAHLRALVRQQMNLLQQQPLVLQQQQQQRFMNHNIVTNTDITHNHPTTAADSTIATTATIEMIRQRQYHSMGSAASHHQQHQHTLSQPQPSPSFSSQQRHQNEQLLAHQLYVQQQIQQQQTPLLPQQSTMSAFNDNFDSQSSSLPDHPSNSNSTNPSITPLPPPSFPK